MVKMHEQKAEAKKGSAREAALEALFRVERDGAYLNLVLPPLLENLPARERPLAMKIASGTIQRLNTLDWSLALFLKRPLGSLTPWIRNLLRLSAYQLLYLERVPAHAVVDEAVRLARRFGHRGVAGLVNAVLRRLASQAASLPWPDRERQLLAHLSIFYSYPEWLVARWVRRFGLDEAEALCRAGNEIVPVSLRPNRIRTEAGILKGILNDEGVDAEINPRLPEMLQVKPLQALSTLDSFQKGLFTVQGESSSLVAPLLDPQPGETILDLCSAPGGKTTHLAELMGGRGRVIAVDLHRARLGLVEETARRLGLSIIETLPADGRAIDRHGLPSPDRILVDAPCSGLGVIRRLPELKWRRREADLPAMQEKQTALLEAAAALLRPGGRLLYSVCSNEPEETTEVAQIFSSKYPSFIPLSHQGRIPASLGEIEPTQAPLELLPHRHRLDGFFIALWRKD